MPGGARTGRGRPPPPGAARLRGTVAAGSACPVLALAGLADLAAVLPGTKRRKLALARNRAARRGPVVVEEAGGRTRPGARSPVPPARAALAQPGEAGVLADERVRRFQRDAAPALHRAGLLRRACCASAAVAAVYYGLRTPAPPTPIWPASTRPSSSGTLRRARVLLFEDLQVGDDKSTAFKPNSAFAVATETDRIATLIEDFQNLDFEHQQHLLLVARALANDTK